MTLTQLRVFCTVVEQGSFRAAARRLDIAQSALTHAIQGLEAELGVSLLTRSHLGIALTPFGEKLLARATAILQDCHRIEQDMRDAAGLPSGEIALGLTSEPLVELLMPVLKTFMQDHPQVTVHVSSGASQMLMERIRGGRLDFALCTLAQDVEDADLHIDRLYPSAPAVLARVGHPKASARSIRDLVACEWVGIKREGVSGASTNRLTALFAEQGLGQPKVAITAETLLESLYLVSETDYLTMDPGVLADIRLFSGALVRIPIRESFAPRDVCLMHRAATPLGLAAQTLSSMLVSFAHLRQGVAGKGGR